MILLIETKAGRRPVAISEQQEPFTELRERLRVLADPFRAERILCDREARAQMDVHMIRQRTSEVVISLAADGRTHEEMFDGIPLVTVDA